MTDEALKLWLKRRFDALAHYDKMTPERQAKLDILIAESDLYVTNGDDLNAEWVLGDLWEACSLNRLMHKAPPPTPEDIAANAGWLAPLAQAVQDAGGVPTKREGALPSTCGCNVTPDAT